MSSSKKNNVRMEKWRLMINDGVYKDPELLKSRIRKGIPSAIRTLAWPEIVKLERFIQENQNKYNYAKLINSPSNNIYEITLDIPRTFPEEEDTKVLRKSMSNVLKAISIVYPKVGYCQGMNFLAARILQVLDDENAFWLLHYLFENDPSLMKNFIDPKKIEQESYTFEQLMKIYIPKVQLQLEQQHILNQIYTVKWFMTIFSSVLNQELFYRIFEVFLNEGWPIIYAVGINLLKQNENQILNNNFQKNIFLINTQIYHINSNNIDKFMQQVYQIVIPKATIHTYNSQFTQILKQKQANKQGQSNRTSHIRLRESQNKKPVLPKPQNQPKMQLVFQSKSLEVMFDSFSLLSCKEENIKATVLPERLKN